MLNMKELRTLSDKELKVALKLSNLRLLRMRGEKAKYGQPITKGSIIALRKEIARIQTIQRERELCKVK